MGRFSVEDMLKLRRAVKAQLPHEQALLRKVGTELELEKNPAQGTQDTARRKIVR